jgi:hypothetical protein
MIIIEICVKLIEYGDMNRFIARVFSWLLAVLHLVFILVLAGTVIDFYADNNYAVRAALLNFGFNPNLFPLIIISVFFSYVIVMGILSTFVAMNENLEKLIDKVKDR